jgi:hypothetical protein
MVELGSSVDFIAVKVFMVKLGSSIDLPVITVSSAHAAFSWPNLVAL